MDLTTFTRDYRTSFLLYPIDGAINETNHAQLMHLTYLNSTLMFLGCSHRPKPNDHISSYIFIICAEGIRLDNKANMK